jgi:hypothetical protein
MWQGLKTEKRVYENNEKEEAGQNWTGGMVLEYL